MPEPERDHKAWLRAMADELDGLTPGLNTTGSIRWALAEIGRFRADAARLDWLERNPSSNDWDLTRGADRLHRVWRFGLKGFGPTLRAALDDLIRVTTEGGERCT
jgi:hypothetical protein